MEETKKLNKKVGSIYNVVKCGGQHYLLTDSELKKAREIRNQKPLSRKEKMRALVDFGECKTMKEARIYLIDMGEF